MIKLFRFNWQSFFKDYITFIYVTFQDYSCLFLTFATVVDHLFLTFLSGVPKSQGDPKLSSISIALELTEKSSSDPPDYDRNLFLSLLFPFLFLIFAFEY